MSKHPKPGSVPSAGGTPSTAERAAIQDARERVLRRTPRLTAKVEVTKSGAVATIGPEHDDKEGWIRRLEDIFGTSGVHFATSQLNHVLMAVRDAKGSYDTSKANSILAAVQGAAPVNELQAMLAVQIAVSHELAMQAMRRAGRVDQIPQYDSAGSMAVKLMRACASHVELLTKLQNGGSQTVRVEHVHVHPGGQAIVGNVLPGGRGQHENGHQPHAPDENQTPGSRSLAAPAGSALSCEDPGGQLVPVPRSKG